LAFGGNNTAGPIDVATARNACASASGRMDFESETFLVQPAHTLRGEGFDASKDGTGRGTPLAPVAFSCKDYGADAGDVAPTLRSMGHDKSHANAGGQVAIAFNARQDPDHWHDRTGPLDTDGGTQAVAFAQNSRDEVREMPYVGALATVRDVAQTITSNYGKQCDNSDTALGPNVAIQSMQVRRLTPTECARLQGFPDDYLDIPYRGKPAADGPKYKALGNSWAVPCVTWIGQRIAASLE
jgi:DNA (cytosine-5)-methyltransferase 1